MTLVFVADTLLFRIEITLRVSLSAIAFLLLIAILWYQPKFCEYEKRMAGRLANQSIQI